MLLVSLSALPLSLNLSPVAIRCCCVWCLNRPPSPEHPGSTSKRPSPASRETASWDALRPEPVVGYSPFTEKQYQARRASSSHRQRLSSPSRSPIRCTLSQRRKPDTPPKAQDFTACTSITHPPPTRTRVCPRKRFLLTDISALDRLLFPS